MTCAFLENEACGLFNIGTGHANTWNAMAEAVFKAINKPSKIGYIDIPKDIIGYQNYTCADMKKSRAVLKEIADCASFESSVIDYICSHLLVQKNW
jgi:ADP-L-glycero-D-manno-heptose 6-epimerase